MTTASRDKIINFLRTGPKSCAQVADHFGDKYGSARTALNRLVKCRAIKVRQARTGLPGGCYLYEVKS